MSSARRVAADLLSDVRGLVEDARTDDADPVLEARDDGRGRPAPRDGAGRFHADVAAPGLPGPQCDVRRAVPIRLVFRD